MAFPSVAASNSPGVGGTSGTSVSVTLPTGSTAGNLIIVAYTQDSATTAPSPSAGWTTIGNGAISTLGYHYIFARVLTGGAQDSLTVTASNNDFAHAVLRITGHRVATPSTDIFIDGTATASTGNADSANLTPAGGAQDFLWITTCGIDMSATTNTLTAAPANYTTGAILVKSASSTSSCATGLGYRQLNAASENPGAFTNTSRPWRAYTIAIPPNITVTGTAAAPLGGMAATGTATVRHNATLAAPLGALAGSSSATVRHNATLAAPLGGLTGNASATVRHSATGSAPLGALAASATATVTGGSNTVTATLAGPLGALSGSASATVTHAATATAPLGALVGAASATVLHVVQATGTAPFGGLQASATANVAHTATASAPLGGLAASATATGGTGIEAVPDDGGSHSYGPRPRLFERPRRLPRLPTRHTATCHAHLGGMTATATARIDWSVLADDEDVLALL